MARRSKYPLPWARKRKGKRKANRGLIAVLLSILTLAVLVAALVTEAGLSWAVVGASSLATAGAVRAQRQEAERERTRKLPPRKPAGTSTPRSNGPRTAAPVPGAVVKCTQTGQPIGDCPCATRHVATSVGASRYGRPVGTPMGRKKREPKVHATHRGDSPST